MFSGNEVDGATCIRITGGQRQQQRFDGSFKTLLHSQERQSSGSSSEARQCCGTVAGTIWRTAALIRAAFKGISGTGTSSTLCDTRSCPKVGEKRPR